MKLFVNNEIRLESISQETTEALYPLFMEDITELNKWFGFDPDYSIKNDYQYLENRMLPYDDAIVVVYHNTPCGRFGLYEYDSKESSIYMYYWISSRFRRKGIALAVMRSILEYLKGLHIREVLFDVDKENIASIRLLERYPNICLKSQNKRLTYSCTL